MCFFTHLNFKDKVRVKNSMPWKMMRQNSQVTVRLWRHSILRKYSQQVYKLSVQITDHRESRVQRSFMIDDVFTLIESPGGLFYDSICRRVMKDATDLKMFIGITILLRHRDELSEAQFRGRRMWKYVLKRRDVDCHLEIVDHIDDEIDVHLGTLWPHWSVIILKFGMVLIILGCLKGSIRSCSF